VSEVPRVSLDVHDYRDVHNGVTLHYAVTGSGPVVLCMHGWPQNHREFLPVVDGLADRETPFFGLDYPGYTDPQVADWHLGMHMHVDITQFLVQGREARPV
jgi:pimeloyl-ACP methyl ester carboxylesterase